jgi:hypothetical protein
VVARGPEDGQSVDRAPETGRQVTGAEGERQLVVGAGLVLARRRIARSKSKKYH